MKQWLEPLMIISENLWRMDDISEAWERASILLIFKKDDLRIY